MINSNPLDYEDAYQDYKKSKRELDKKLQMDGPEAVSAKERSECDLKKADIRTYLHT